MPLGVKLEVRETNEGGADPTAASFHGRGSTVSRF